MKTSAALFLVLVLFGGVLAVKAAPTITAQPLNRTNNVGDNARFTVTATGASSYQWKFNGTDIAGATTSVCNIAVVDSGQAGTYTVVVRDAANDPTTSADAVLSIPFASRTRITYWNFNTSPTPDNNTGTGTTSPASGVGTLSVNAASANGFNDGSVSDPAPSDNSSRRWNKVSATAANKTAGARYAVSTQGYKNIAVSGELWLPGGGPAYWRGQYTINGTDWVDRLLINRRGANFTGFIYFCDDLTGIAGVENNPSFAYQVVAEWQSTATGTGSDALISVDPGTAFGGLFGWDMVTFMGDPDTPVITTQPQSRTHQVGEDATFTVVATGASLQYQWRRAEGGVPTDIPNATSSALVLNNVQMTDANTYSVRVSNSAGSVISDDAVLTVQETLPPGDRYWSGDGATLGGAGTWDTTNPRWGTSSGGPFSLTWNNASGDSAVFAATGTAAGAVALGSSVAVNRITVTNTSGTSTYSFTGNNTITFAGDDAGIYLAGVPGTTSDVNSMNMSCMLSGGVVIKNGGGRLNLSNTGNSVGRWIIQDGALTGSTADRIAGTGNPASLVTDYFTLDGGGLGFAVGGSMTVGANRGIYLGPTAGNKLGCQDTGTVTFNGPITGPGGVSFPGFNSWPGRLQGSAATFVFSNPANDYKGATTVAVGALRCGAAEVIPDTTTLTVSGTARLDVSGFTETVGNVIVNGSSARLQDTVGGGLLIATNYDLREGGTQTAVLGGSATLTKTTTGQVELTGANTYSGGTVIEAGTLLVNNTSGSGTGSGGVTINGGTLAGIGSISGVVTVNTSGTVSPGPGIGTLTMGSSPSLGGNVLMEVNTANTPTSNRLVVNGVLRYGGMLTIDNIGPALVGGETFTLFSASDGFQGGFTSIIGAPGPGLNYWGGNLTTDGTIYVNRAPTAQPWSMGARGGATTAVQVIGGKHNPSDPDGDTTLTVSSVSPPTRAGATVTTDGTSITYTAASTDTGGTDTFTYTVSDGHGGTSDAAMVTVAVANGNGGSLTIVRQPWIAADGRFHVIFAGIAGFHYQVQTAEVGGSDYTWSNLGDPQQTGDNGLLEIIDPVPPNGPGRIYRLTEAGQ